MENSHLQELDELIAKEWQKFFTSDFALKAESIIEAKDKRLYALYMTQVYHYAYYTPRSLATSGANLFNEDTELMLHFFEHALEETGHDMMAFNDIKAMGVLLNSRKDIPPMLASTETMVSYVSFLSNSSEPYRSLGYHYWIEQPYVHIQSFMNTLYDGLDLTESQFLFYRNHERLDKKHGKDIQDILVDYCKTDTQWASVFEVTLTTMQQFIKMVEEILLEYDKLKKNSPSDYEILNILTP